MCWSERDSHEGREGEDHTRTPYAWQAPVEHDYVDWMQTWREVRVRAEDLLRA